MRFILSVSFVFFLTEFVVGQRLFPTIFDTTQNVRMISLDGSAELSSTSIDNSILNRFIAGGEISENNIDRNIARQRILNRTGAIFYGNLKYEDYKSHLFKRPKLGYAVQLGYHQITDVTYTDQLFGLIFKGNEEYAGKSIDLNSTSFYSMAYQKLGFGILFKPSKSYVFINLINVSDYKDGGIDHGTIKQSNELDNVILDVSGNYNQPYKPNFVKGYGISFDAAYNLPIHFFKNRNAKLKISFNDIGFSYIYGGVHHYELNTIKAYQGFTIKQLVNGVKTDQSSLLDTLGVTEKDGAKWMALPFSIEISKGVNEDYEGEFQSVFGIRVYPIASFRPLIFVGADYKPVQKLHIGAMASYGGYAAFRGTIYVQYQTRRFGFGIGCDNIVGMVSKRFGFGQTYNLRLSCAL